MRARGAFDVDEAGPGRAIPRAGVSLALLVIVIIAIAYANRDAKESQRPAERPFYGSYNPSHRF